MNEARLGPVLGVGGVVIREGRVLLIRRGKQPLAGRWSIPGGRVEWGETLAQAVVRELHEETGLKVRVLELIEVVERIFNDQLQDAGAPPPAPLVRDASSTPEFHFVILDYYCEAATGEACAGGDAREIAWAPEEELPRYHLTDAALRVIRRAFALARQRPA